MAEQFVTANKTTESPEGGLTAVAVRGAPIALASAASTDYAFHDTLEKRTGRR
jgi:hypothetical protein